jgi:hypothetical protein
MISDEDGSEAVLKDHQDKIYELLKDDFDNPSFIAEIMDFEKIELIQGLTFKVAPHYRT